MPSIVVPDDWLHPPSLPWIIPTPWQTSDCEVAFEANDKLGETTAKEITNNDSSKINIFFMKPSLEQKQ
jgi:hypothetical protein